MNRPFCLIGDINSAKEYISNNYPDANYEFLILNTDISIEDLKHFRDFLEESSLIEKVGVIYAFSNLSSSKQSVLLKIFESLPKHVHVILHSFHNVDFTVHTRCDVIYLSSLAIQEDWNWFNEKFFEVIKTNSLTDEMKNGIDLFLRTLHFYNVNLLSKIEKDCILESLK